MSPRTETKIHSLWESYRELSKTTLDNSLQLLSITLPSNYPTNSPKLPPDYPPKHPFTLPWLHYSPSKRLSNSSLLYPNFPSYPSLLFNALFRISPLYSSLPSVKNLSYSSLFFQKYSSELSIIIHNTSLNSLLYYFELALFPTPTSSGERFHKPNMKQCLYIHQICTSLHKPYFRSVTSYVLKVTRVHRPSYLFAFTSHAHPAGLRDVLRQLRLASVRLRG